MSFESVTSFRPFAEITSSSNVGKFQKSCVEKTAVRLFSLRSTNTGFRCQRDLCFQYPCPPEKEECTSWVQLQGPHSPLEIDIIQMTAVGKFKRAIVESNSVNSVLLDENSDRSTRLLIAQNVSHSTNSNQLFLRNTTLLPNVPGLTALLALIFAPRVELRCSPLKTYYTGALCGLGPMDSCTNRSILPDHDMEIPFDIDISSDDLREVRRSMSIELHVTPCRHKIR